MFTMHFYEHIYQNYLLGFWSYLNEKTKTNSSKKVNTRCKTQRQRHSAKRQRDWCLAPVCYNTRSPLWHLSLVTSEKWRNNELTRRMELLYESNINVIKEQHLLRKHKVRTCYTCILWFIIPHWQSLYTFIADKIVINMHISLPKFIQQYWNRSTHSHKLFCWNLWHCMKT